MPRTKSAETRARILKAATRRFGETGYHATSIGDLATDLGMGHGTFYRYFKNKREIFQVIVDDVPKRLRSLLMTERPDAADSLEAYRAQVGRIARRVFELLGDGPDELADVAHIIFVEAYGVDAELRGHVERGLALLATMTAAYLDNGVERGFLRRDLDVAVTASAINGMVIAGVRSLARSGRDGDAEQLLTSWSSAVTRLMFDGIGRPDSAATPGR